MSSIRPLGKDTVQSLKITQNVFFFFNIENIYLKVKNFLINNFVAIQIFTNDSTYLLHNIIKIYFQGRAQAARASTSLFSPLS